jgi:hypothetical protein
MELKRVWQREKDSNLRMPESKSGALVQLGDPPIRKCLEEEQGFEPWVELASYTGLAGQRLKPLIHPSGTFATQYTRNAVKNYHAR